MIVADFRIEQERFKKLGFLLLLLRLQKEGDSGRHCGLTATTRRCLRLCVAFACFRYRDVSISSLSSSFIYGFQAPRLFGTYGLRIQQLNNEWLDNKRNHHKPRNSTVVVTT